MNDDEILQKLGLSDESPAYKQKALEGVNYIIEARMAGVIQDLLTEEQLEQFSNMENSKSKEEIYQWLGTIFGNLDEMYESLLDDYVNEFKGKAGQYEL